MPGPACSGPEEGDGAMTGLLLSALGAATGGAVVVFLAHKLLKAKEPWESVVRD